MNVRILISRSLFTLVIGCGVNAHGEVLKFNPFEKPEAMSGEFGTGSSSGGLKLRGTVIDGKHSLVNINGEYYRLQQEVSGYQIIQIESGQVTLQRGENKMVLTLNDEK